MTCVAIQSIFVHELQAFGAGYLIYSSEIVGFSATLYWEERKHGHTQPHRCTSKGSTSEFRKIVASLSEQDTSESRQTLKTPLDVHTKTRHR
jgi:hypothetical protein